MNAEMKERIKMINKGGIPTGYKKTKVGIIPEDWEERKLDEISKITMGQSPGSENYNENNIGLPLIQGNADMINRYTSPKLYTSEITKICEVDDIIMSVRAPVGEFSKSIHRACIGRGVCSIRPIEKNDYLYYYLIKNEGLWVKYSQGSTFESVNSDDIKSFIVVQPKPKIEQQKIAHILSTWDNAIELKENLLEMKEEQKKGLMQSLLTGKIRLTGFKGEWEKNELRELGIIITGTTPSTRKKEYYSDNGYPWITPSDIDSKKYISTSERNLTESGMKVGRFIPARSLVVTCIASIGKNAILTVDGSCNQQINAIFNEDKTIIEYLYYLLSYKKDYMKKRAGSSATEILNKKSFEELKFKIPGASERKAIANILSTADKEIELLNEEIDMLKEQKKGLMQLLLTGIVRV
ncbi:MAG: restriction endonuclease subunit S, partial [Bacilli bacterium]|nr:restriction endonuclease subunit S [Bacilli bacterium]